ncbi:MAG: hypothetical protein EP306_13905, partial [Burkholderiales bacterium]
MRRRPGSARSRVLTSTDTSGCNSTPIRRAPVVQSTLRAAGPAVGAVQTMNRPHRPSAETRETPGTMPRWPRAHGVLALLMLAVAGCGGSDAPSTTAEARGQVLFSAAGANCVQCHVDASSLRRDASDAPMLADRIAAAIAANTGRMGEAQYGYDNLARSQLLDLSAYLVSRAPQEPASEPPGASPAVASQCTSTGSSSVRTEVFTSGLASPWAMAFLPDRRVLVSQKAGTLVLVSANGASRTTLGWGQPAPAIRDGGQGGLLDSKAAVFEP